MTRSRRDIRIGGLLTAMAAAAGTIGCGGGHTNKTAATPVKDTSLSTQHIVVLPPPSHEVAPGVVRSSSRGVTATMRMGSSHRPRVSQPWLVDVTVSDRGHPTSVHVDWQYWFKGALELLGGSSHFTGSIHHVVHLPARTLRFIAPLMFRAALDVRGVKLNLDFYPLQPVR